MDLFLVSTQVSDLELFPRQKLLATDNWRGDSIVGGRSVINQAMHHGFAEDGLDDSEGCAASMRRKVLQDCLQVISIDFSNANILKSLLDMAIKDGFVVVSSLLSQVDERKNLNCEFIKVHISPNKC